MCVKQRGRQNSLSNRGAHSTKASLAEVTNPAAQARHSANDILFPMTAPKAGDGVSPSGLIHLSLPVGLLQCNCSIIGDPATREALVLDPGDEIGRIMDLIGRHKLNVKAIVSTHAHIDHVGGLKKLHDYTGAPVLMHRDDVPLYQAMEMQAGFLGIEPPA